MFFQTAARWIPFTLLDWTKWETLSLYLEVRRKVCWDSGPVDHIASGSLHSLMLLSIYTTSGTR